jgi:hypothetical protein
MIAKDFVPYTGIRSFAIMEGPPETRPGRQSRAGIGNSRAPGDELAMICPGWLADCGPAGYYPAGPYIRINATLRRFLTAAHQASAAHQA